MITLVKSNGVVSVAVSSPLDKASEISLDSRNLVIPKICFLNLFFSSASRSSIKTNGVSATKQLKSAMMDSILLSDLIPMNSLVLSLDKS